MIVTKRETDDNTKRTWPEKNRPEDKIKEYKHTDKMKKEEKKRLSSSTESVKELAFFFSSEIPDAYSSQKVPKRTTVHSNMPL